MCHCVRVHVSVPHVCVHVRVHVCVSCVRVSVSLHVCVCVCVCMCVCVCVHECVTTVYVHVHVYVWYTVHVHVCGGVYSDSVFHPSLRACPLCRQVSYVVVPVSWFSETLKYKCTMYMYKHVHVSSGYMCNEHTCM